MKHEPIENEFSRKSKRYRTKYFSELEKLYGDATKPHRVDQEEISTTTPCNRVGKKIMR